MWKRAAAVALLAAATSAGAQYESAVSDYGQLQLDNVLAKRRLQQAQQRHGGGSQTALSPNARAICLDKKRVAARHTPAEGRRLYALCAQAGY